MANEFLKNWQPTIKEGGDLKLKTKLPVNEVETNVWCSEGDTLFINQIYDNENQHINIGRHELYDLVYNFMSSEELEIIYHKKRLSKH